MIVLQNTWHCSTKLTRNIREKTQERRTFSQRHTKKRLQRNQIHRHLETDILQQVSRKKHYQDKKKKKFQGSFQHVQMCLQNEVTWHGFPQGNLPHYCNRCPMLLIIYEQFQGIRAQKGCSNKASVTSGSTPKYSASKKPFCTLFCPSASTAVYSEWQLHKVQ